MSDPSGTSPSHTLTPQPVPPDPAAWFDTPGLIARSRPQIGRGIVWMPLLSMMGLIAAIVVVSATPNLVGLTLGLALLGGSMGITFYLGRLASGAKAERQRVRRVEELVMLRHWGHAAGEIRSILSQPMKLQPSRRTALVALARILGRYELYDDAVDVADAVMDDPGTDPGTRFAVGCGRAMLLLQSGRLSDANDAIGKLRSDVKQIDATLRRIAREKEERSGDSDSPSPAEPVEAMPEDLPAAALLDDESSPPPSAPSSDVGFDSAALTLVELYRDVQTNHNEEALETLAARRDDLRAALGLRLGDALALGAVASHRLGKADDAARLWADATCLVAPVELLRRYPETKDVAQAHPATPHPANDTGWAVKMEGA